MTTTKTIAGGPADLMKPSRRLDARRAGTGALAAGAVAARGRGSSVVASSVLLARTGRAIEQAHDPADQAAVLGRRAHLGTARVRQVDRHVGDDPARPAAHDQDPARQKDGLEDVVGDERDGPAPQ